MGGEYFGMDMFEDEEDAAKEIPVGLVNPFLQCGICKGYFRNAHAVKECLHTFCRFCILNHLDVHRKCPTCLRHVDGDVLKAVAEARTWQALVDKLLPQFEALDVADRRSIAETGQLSAFETADECWAATRQGSTAEASAAGQQASGGAGVGPRTAADASGAAATPAAAGAAAGAAGGGSASALDDLDGPQVQRRAYTSDEIEEAACYVRLHATPRRARRGQTQAAVLAMPFLAAAGSLRVEELQRHIAGQLGEPHQRVLLSVGAYDLRGKDHSLEFVFRTYFQKSATDVMPLEYRLVGRA